MTKAAFFKIILFLLMVTALSVVILFLSLEWFSPGQLFVPLIIIFAIVILPVAFILSPKLLHAIQFILKKDAPSTKIGFSWRFFSIYCIVVLPIFVAFVAWDSLSPTTYISTKIYNNLPAAHEDFSVQLIGGMPDFQPDYALSVFEKEYSELRLKYLPPFVKQRSITIRLYPNEVDLNNALKMPFMIGGAFVFEKGELIIHVPADSTGAYKHELMHAVTFQLLGEVKYYSVERWFVESLAISEEKSDPMANIDDAIYLWRNRDYFSSFARFKALKTEPNELYYAGSRQLFRHLNLKFGEDAIPNVLTNIKNGSSFDSAIEIETSLSPEKLYDSWAEWYFN